MAFTRLRRSVVLIVLLLVVTATGGVGVAAGAVSAPSCVTRTLILSAYPAEADAVLSHMQLDAEPALVVDGHHFYLGTMSGVPVISSMTGIGLVNATTTTETALSKVTCAATGSQISTVLFSGVAGGAGRSRIADVVVPARWTLDDGRTWRGADPGLLARASALAGTGIALSHVNTAGDPACTCTDTSAVPIVDLQRQAAVWVGGDGYSSDTNNGKAAECTPGAGDTLGCEPCRAPDRSPVPDVAATAPALADLLLSNLSGGSQGTTSASGNVYDAVDEETAAVQVVADGHGVPFLGFRGISDGPGDPLGLPGFPVEFFVYKQVAADNAATAVAAFLALPVAPAASPLAALTGAAGAAQVEGETEATGGPLEAVPPPSAHPRLSALLRDEATSADRNGPNAAGAAPISRSPARSHARNRFAIALAILALLGTALACGQVWRSRRMA